jgi:hypothetical protein
MRERAWQILVLLELATLLGTWALCRAVGDSYLPAAIFFASVQTSVLLGAATARRRHHEVEVDIWQAISQRPGPAHRQVRIEKVRTHTN